MRIYKNNYFVLIMILLVVGCTKFVQIGPPTTELVTASVFSDNSSATAAQVAIYTSMVNNYESAYMAVNCGLLGDELTNYENSTNYIPFYINQLTASENPGPWNTAYNYIYQANAIISAIQSSSSLSPAVQRQLLGESKFIRAFWFFYLTNLYGDVPLVLTTDYKVNATIARTSKSLVYQQIVSDLIAAKTLMNVNYIDATDTAVTTDRSRPIKWAATALLARVYLYTGDNSDAESEADSVINNASLYGLCSIDSVFLANSNEAIWQLGIPLPTNYNTPDAQVFILLGQPGGGQNCCSISPQLLNSFEPGDGRRMNWIDSFQVAGSPVTNYYYPYKYKVRDSTVVVENVMVLRLAEQYLIRAEAQVKQGNMGGAVNDLNTIRQRASLNPYAGATDQQSVMTAILHERQVELFTEWGHRWLDLIRTNSVDSVMTVVTPFKSSGSTTWSANNYQALFPIPQLERNVDVNLTQNPGY